MNFSGDDGRPPVARCCSTALGHHKLGLSVLLGLLPFMYIHLSLIHTEKRAFIRNPAPRLPIFDIGFSHQTMTPRLIYKLR